MFKKLIETKDDVALTVLRVLLGVVFFPHGAQKVFGWFGGYGFSKTMDGFTSGLGIPAVFAFLAIVAEFFGALGLITGLLTRVAAFGIACVMVVATFMLHFQVGFFMNWKNVAGRGEGFEYHVLAVAICVALMIRGGGKWSVDGILAKKM